MYLEPRSVAAMDDLSRALDISRSQIVRDVISRVMREYEKLLTAAASFRKRKNPILQMAGCLKGLSPNLSQNVDEIYLKD